MLPTPKRDVRGGTIRDGYAMRSMRTSLAVDQELEFFRLFEQRAPRVPYEPNRRATGE